MLPVQGGSPGRTGSLFDGACPTAATPDTGRTERLHPGGAGGPGGAGASGARGAGGRADPAGHARTERPPFRHQPPNRPQARPPLAPRRPGSRPAMKEPAPALPTIAPAGRLTRLIGTPHAVRTDRSTSRGADTEYCSGTGPNLGVASPPRCAPPAPAPSARR